MSADQEHVFAREAQDEAILTQSGSSERQDGSSSKKDGVHTEVAEADDSSSENNPLLGSEDRRRKRQHYDRASNSYLLAINEPWGGAYGHADRPWYKKPSILWLLPAFMPFCIAFGGIIVPKTYLILDLICNDYLNDQAAKDPSFSYLPIMFGEENKQCDIPEVQQLVSYFNTYLNLIAGLLSAIAAPFLGSLSDRYGRKKLIVCTSMGAFAGELITIIVGRAAGRISVYWILLGAVCDGMCGSFTTALALSFAYATDCTSPTNRAVAFGYFHGTLFTGIALGPLVAGILIKLTGNILIPFYLALGCHCFFILFTGLIVPESLSEERQLVAREKYKKERVRKHYRGWLNRIKDKIRQYNIFEPLAVLRPTGEGSSPALRRNLMLMASIDTLMFGVVMGTMSILLIYAKFRFHWSTVESSFFVSACNVARVSGLLILLPLLTRLFRGSQDHSAPNRGSDMLDLYIIRATVAIDLMGYLGYAFAPSGAFMYPAGLIAALGGIGSPTLASSLTKHVPASMTGQIMGASALLHAIARVVAPPVFNLIYAATVATYSGFVFLCLGSVFVVVFLMSWFLKPNVYLKDATTLDPSDQTQNRDRD